MTRAIYYLLENINLTGAERDAFFALNEQEGADNESPYPNLRNHWRTRLDDEAMIFEGDFPQLNVGRIVSLMNQAIGGNNGFLPDPTGEYGFTAVIRSGPPGAQDLCRFIIFGGISATWDESHEVVLQYLSDNLAAWEDVPE